MALCLSPFFKTGQTLACFQSIGIVPVESDFWNRSWDSRCYVSTEFFEYFATDLVWACCFMWIYVVQ